MESDSESSEGGGPSEPEDGPVGEGVVHKGRLLRERKRHKWGDYQAVLTARALYLYSREYVSPPVNYFTRHSFILPLLVPLDNTSIPNPG